MNESKKSWTEPTLRTQSAGSTEFAEGSQSDGGTAPNNFGSSSVD